MVLVMLGPFKSEAGNPPSIFRSTPPEQTRTNAFENIQYVTLDMSGSPGPSSPKRQTSIAPSGEDGLAKFAVGDHDDNTLDVIKA